MRRLSSVHSNHKRIAAGAAVIGVLTLVAKLFAAGREIAIAWRYGIGPMVDSYQLSLTVTTWLPMMLTSVVTVVLVPRLVALRGRPERCRLFISELNGTIVLLGAAVAAATFVAAPSVSYLLAGPIGPGALELTSTMSRSMSALAMFVIAVSYFSARLQARERFAYSVTEAIPAIVIALFMIAFLPTSGAPPLVLGTLAGFLLQALLLWLMVQRSEGVGSISFRHRSPEWKSLYTSVVIMAAAQGILAFSIPIDQAFAARIGEGAVATLGYASRIIILFSGLATIVVGRALLPVLSSAAADGDFETGRRHAVQWACLLFGASAAASAVLWLAAPELVRLIFQRGAFDAAASADVSRALRFGLFQLPPFFGGIALVQWYAATGQFQWFLAITAASLALKIVLNILLTPILNLEGIILSTSAMYFLSVVILLALIGRIRAPDSKQEVESQA